MVEFYTGKIVINKIYIYQDITQRTNIDIFLEAAINEAKKGMSQGGIPIGSVLVIDGQIVGRGHNKRVQNGSTVLHAEMDCLENFFISIICCFFVYLLIYNILLDKF